ncbi:uncharacterized protein PV09_09019 [Verruconis gallopava]|uniref:Cytochrome P450 n=1 Tax=Verruconis gallopava TaxID=253628 RepID=A0A0D1ZXR3_9PEZI|nr:uncharacterized protein PV09_09019 [Verruconis gallopava]KIV99247.1 hypothetical protein PV09_09019 [Verruconis gallopava]
MGVFEVVVTHPQLALNLICVLTFVLVTFQIATYLYNIFFHPLRHFPGPKSHAASSLPYVISQLRGELQHEIVKLHEIYGEVVRVLPNELSFSSANAWKDIYGHRKGGEPTLQKFHQFYSHPFNDGVHDIINGDDETHSRMRRIFANAFSDRSLKMQESLFLTYVDRLVENIRTTLEEEPSYVFDMVMMYNFTTFDIMGDLAFGESLDLLKDSTYHGWIRAMFANFKFGAYLHSVRYFPLLEWIMLNLLRFTHLEEKRNEHKQFSSSRVDKRLARKDARPDIWGLVISREDGTGLSRLEMYKNADVFMIAGTETTATLLSGLTFHLLKNPEKLKKLTQEIRSSFQDDSEITIEKLQALPYLHACIQEGLRMYPPVSNGLPRVVPPQGARIDARPVPGGTIVYSQHLATYRNAKNFRDPYSFLPERWIENEYASDLKQALNPFSVGPRACLGKNMAYHEIRLILSKVLWNFDLELCEQTSENWANTKKIYVLWEKEPLWCRARYVNHA